MNNSERRLPSDGDLLVERDIQALLDAAEHPRDKAFISVLWESGARIGEVGELNIGNVKFDNHGIVISVNGKTGARNVRLVMSVPYLTNWINNHPFKRNKTAPLWINVGTTNHNAPMKYRNIQKLLANLFKKAKV